MELPPTICAFWLGEYIHFEPMSVAGPRIIAKGRSGNKQAIAAIERQSVKIEDRPHFDNWHKFLSRQGQPDANRDLRAGGPEQDQDNKAV